MTSTPNKEVKKISSDDSDYQKIEQPDIDFEEISDDDGFVVSDKEIESDNKETNEPNTLKTEKITRKEMDQLVEDSNISKYRPRRFKKIKRQDGIEQPRSSSYLDNFIVDDIGEVADKDDYNHLNNKNSYSNEAISIATSIFGDLSEFLSHQILPNNSIPNLDPTIDFSTISNTSKTSRSHLHKLTIPNINEEIFLKNESKYIYKNFYLSKDSSFIDYIFKTLKLLREYSVPFIDRYKKGDWFEYGLSIKNIWEIHDYDNMYINMYKRINTLKNTSINHSHPKKMILEFIENHLKSESNLVNVKKYVKFIKNNKMFINNKVVDIVGSDISLSDRIFDLSHTNRLIDKNVNLNEIICEVYGKDITIEKCEQIINSTVHSISKAISLNPYIRSYIKTEFYNTAIINTSPTKKGYKSINWMNPYFIVKKLCDKPIKNFLTELEEPLSDSMPESFAILSDAYKKGYINVKIDLPIENIITEQENDFLNTTYKYGMIESSLKNLYLTKNEALNRIRDRIIDDTLKKYLIPEIKKEIFEELLKKSHESIAKTCTKKLIKRINVKGYSGKFPLFSVYIGEYEDKTPIFVSVLDEFGNLLNFSKYEYMKISKRNENNQEILERKNRNINRLKKLIIKYSPMMVIISGNDVNSEICLMDIEKACAASESIIRCELVNPDISKIYAESSRSEKEFPEYEFGLKAAISLGRLIIDPVSEISALWSMDHKKNKKEILSLKLGYHQELVPEHILLKYFERALIERVAENGVDINSLVENDHKLSILDHIDFVDKNTVNLKDIFSQRVSYVYSRKELASVLPKRVYKNIIPFIKVNEVGDMNKSKAEEIEYYDRTRIHPDHYGIADLIVRSLVKGHPELDNLSKEEQIKELKKISDFSLNINSFINEVLPLKTEFIKNETHLNLVSIVKLILKELSREFYCLSVIEFSSIPEEDLFWLLTHESPRTLRVGQLVIGTICKIQSNTILFSINNCSINGIIPSNKLIDSEDSNYPEMPSDPMEINKWMRSIVRNGMTLSARIEEIQMTRNNYFIYLDARRNSIDDKEQFENPASIYFPKRLDSFLSLLENHDNYKEEKEIKEITKHSFIPRKIDFPLFKNLNRIESEKYLEDKEIGEIIIRPSSRGPNYLTATWKISRDPYICVNIEIREKEKENSYSIGKVLEIDTLKFEDLDEIHAMFFEKMTQKLKKMMSFRRFRFGTEKEVEQLVLFEKKGDHNAIPYSIGFSLKHPGWLCLFYVFSTNVKSEYISILPDGYKFRGKTFSNPESLITWFKKNPYEKSPYYQKNDNGYSLYNDDNKYLRYNDNEYYGEEDNYDNQNWQ